ncbi:hypothetical protein [uncultured Parabacteroides sp.]|uniref:hypothetical protein n=1 Tax=uncultured Parabacteroides sp. TaxID=512312 RepID=UPI002803B9FE|nr:hypothetical protein [uncultured Parabacteroides sp.]
MKLKNILSFFCFLAAMASCSMEDDILNEMGTRPIEENVSGEACISIKTLLASGAETKSLAVGDAISASDAEAKINTCSLILLNGDVVQAVADGVHVNDDNVVVKNASVNDTVKFMVKVNQANYRLMVVANSSSTFTGCVSLSDVESKIQSDNVADLVKVGMENVTFPTGFEGYTSTIESAQHPVMTEITLEQLTARVELLGFNVSFINDTEPVDIVIEEIMMKNINTKSYIGSTPINADCFTTDSKSYSPGVKVFIADGTATSGTYTFGATGNESIHPFYTYRNANNPSLLQMAVRYKADGVTKTTKWIIINEGNPIQNGYIYRLTINAKVTSDEFDCAVQFSTKQWVKHTMSVDMNEKTN